MAIWAPEKKDTLTALSSEILHNYGVGRSIVAVDGRWNAGAAALADDLAEAMRVDGRRVFRASLGNFHRPRSRWESADPASAAAYYGEAFDYSVLRRVLIDPFRASGSTGFVLAAYDAHREAPIQPKWMTAGSDAILIVDGVFLNRQELAGLWNFSIWVEVLPTESAGADSVGANLAVAGADELYIDQVGPRAAATAIIDNRDVEHPRRVFADSC